MPQKTRVSLILRVAHQHDVEAWQQFVAIYQPLVFRIAIAQGLQQADAHDLVQEVMTRVARSVSSWDPDSKRGTFRGWIGTIARNLIVDFLRNRNRLPRTSDDAAIRRLVEQQPEPSQESDFFDREFEKQTFAWAAAQVQQQVQEKTWQAFWQTAVEQKTIERVATDLRMSVGAVYIARSRVMSRLKSIVKTQMTEFE